MHASGSDPRPISTTLSLRERLSFKSRLAATFDVVGMAGFQIQHFGAQAIDETTRQYTTACAGGHHDTAEFWCEVLQVLHLAQDRSPEGTTWEVARPTEAAEALLADYTRDQAGIVIEAAIAETRSAGLHANCRFWSAALTWLRFGRPATVGMRSRREPPAAGAC